jgi:cytochrome c oxidase subunit 3
MSASLNLSHEPVTKIASGKIAMWAFLASELMFFTGFFGTFIVLRNTNYQAFFDASHHLNWVLALVNTFILIGSSLTMAMAIYKLERRENGPFQVYLGLTILGACGFYSFYFLMTGFHALHVIGGMIPMLFMLFKSFTNKGYPYPVKVEALGLYWHFVDLMWIFIFPALYLIFP